MFDHDWTLWKQANRQWMPLRTDWFGFNDYWCPSRPFGAAWFAEEIQSHYQPQKAMMLLKRWFKNVQGLVLLFSCCFLLHCNSVVGRTPPSLLQRCLPGQLFSWASVEVKPCSKSREFADGQGTMTSSRWSIWPVFWATSSPWLIWAMALPVRQWVKLRWWDQLEVARVGGVVRRQHTIFHFPPNSLDLLKNLKNALLILRDNHVF